MNLCLTRSGSTLCKVCRRYQYVYWFVGEAELGKAWIVRMQHGEVLRVAECRLRVGLRSWAYAQAHRAEIMAEFEHQCAMNPGYFNGQIFILLDHRVEQDTLVGEFAAADFWSFVYWRSRDHADDSVRDCFGCAMVRSCEGHVLLGVQAGGHLNAGRAYCPSGFIDPADVRRDGAIDIDGSITREIAEETGLELRGLTRSPGYVLVAAGASIAIGVEYWTKLPTEQLRVEVLVNLARQSDPELADILLVRSPAELVDRPTAAHIGPLLRALW